MKSKISEDWNTYRGIKYLMELSIEYHPFIPDTEFSNEQYSFNELNYKIWIKDDVNKTIIGSVLLRECEDSYGNINHLEIDENDSDTFLDLLSDLKSIFPKYFRLRDFGYLFEDLNCRINKLIKD